MSFNLINPIPEATRDAKILQEFFEKWQIVPYYGDRGSTSHSFLNVLRNSSELSPTHNACKEAIIKYTFGNSIDVKRQTINSIPGFVNKTSEPLPPLPDSEKEAYLNKLTSIGINLLHIQELNRLLYNNLSDSGNAYLHIKIIKIGSEFRLSFNSINYIQAAFLATKPIEDKHLVVTKYWDEEYWKTVQAPSLFKVSNWIDPFKWATRRNNTIWETVVHIKTVKDECIYYGRPNTLPVLNQMYIEYANSDLECKIAGTELVTKTLLLFEEIDPTRTKVKKSKNKDGTPKSKENNKSAFQQYMKNVKQLTTSEGEYLVASSVAGVQYPFGQKAPTHISLAINRDTQFSESTTNRAAKKICAAHSWDRRLTGDAETKGGLGSNLILSLFIQRNESTIVPGRSFWENFWCNVLKEVGLVALPGEIMHCFEFPDVVDGMIEKLKGETTGSMITNPIVEIEEIQEVNEGLTDKVNLLENRIDNLSLNEKILEDKINNLSLTKKVKSK